ncbi:ParB/RepB/Spo0J family partition protein [Sagittula salina]|uniref:ParB N-terminal domain-containing protein n=1 Tax=Sagittula salina TaxID=2820268 RepID=A0A940MM10_9RHOB|nr:ParB N-terminal domain-containing protein [Sagittula salina]MBP0483971.1 ParB N-terminal domain-containing protein [Sagittula salina]
MADILTTITELPLDEIGLGDRLRPVSPAGVEALKASIRDLGVIKDAIHVRKIKKTGAYVLLAGGHRLTAARALRDEGMAGMDPIKVVCWSCNDDFAKLMEIDDNLAGAELTPLDTAVFLAERKKVYEKLHPETRAQVGAGLVAKRWDTAETISVVSFAESVSERLGCTPRHVRSFVRAGEALSGGDARRLRSAPRPVTLADLVELSKITHSGERIHVVDALAQGRARNATAARAQYRSDLGEGPAPKDATDAGHARLKDAWTRANKAARRRFLEDLGTEVRALLDEMGDQ